MWPHKEQLSSFNVTRLCQLTSSTTFRGGHGGFCS